MLKVETKEKITKHWTILIDDEELESILVDWFIRREGLPPGTEINMVCSGSIPKIKLNAKYTKEG